MSLHLKVSTLLLLVATRCADSFTLHPTISNQRQQRDRHSTPPLLVASVPTQGMDPLPEVQVVSFMPDPIPMDLQNDYFLLRHGQSTANVAGIISSARSLAYSTKHGLTPLGYQQGFDAADQLVGLLKDSDNKNVVFVSSPFARAYQTAQACLDGLAADKQQLEFSVDTSIRVKNNLMERHFGRLDDEAIYTYAYVWPVDKFNVTHTAFDVESVAAVSTRLHQVVMELEEEYDNTNIVLVSHADVLQICQLYGANVDNVGLFSSFRFGNGEVRHMARTPDSLPPPSPLEAPDRETKTFLPEDSIEGSQQ